ncbi:hypothetical protein [Cylindrospermopsis raciborskii]|uniref:hypothetical protein n=1 Tax=Cylindrospermopsis raciborskii TaxID=77022 RepID=UPI0015C4CD1D|nr:hypothetical protein [Cylindrospermopsis raciborskii]
MANITVSDLNLSHSENYVNDLTEKELKTYGGYKSDSAAICKYFGPSSASCKYAKLKGR